VSVTGSVAAYDLVDGVDEVHGCPEQLRRLVLNLVVNAGEALRELDGLVTVRVSSDDGQVVLAVRDDGVGMSSEVRIRVLAPGFSTKAIGRGLGLEAVAGIARAHGGQVGLCSTEGGGTTVLITLPSAPAEPAPMRVVGASRTVGMPTVLVVDDDDEVREVVAALVLRSAGYRVLTAAIPALRFVAGSVTGRPPRPSRGRELVLVNGSVIGGLRASADLGSLTATRMISVVRRYP
jgi:hypothetical protein